MRTYPEDILDAFAGLTSVLSLTFDGGFICGLLQMFFDPALLWQPWRPLDRRRAVRSPGGHLAGLGLDGVAICIREIGVAATPT